MLQFLKKTGRTTLPSLEKQPATTSTEIISPADDLERLQRAEDAVLSTHNANEVATESKCRNFRALMDILLDQNCLCYFVQFMEAQQQLPLVRFWLDVENFRVSAQLCEQGKATGSGADFPNGDQSHSTPPLNDQDDAGKVVVHNGHGKQPMAANQSIENRPLTDDEKTEIINEDKRNAKRKVATEEVEISGKGRLQRKRSSQFQTTVAADAIRIYEKYLLSTSTSWIADLPAPIHSTISVSLCGCDESSTLVSPHCFAEAQQFLFERMEREYLNRFLESEFYCKYCVDILTDRNLSLADILYSESILFYFMEFIEQEQRRDYLDFWMAAVNFRANGRCCEVTGQLQSDALVLYDKYFSLQASNPLHFSNQVRCQVEEGICTTKGSQVQVAVFELPLRIVEQYLAENYLAKFIASDLFYKHLSELFNRIQEGEGSLAKASVARTKSMTFEKGGREAAVASKRPTGHRKTNSDCGGADNLKRINSISSQNTLLATETGTCQRHHQQLKTALSSDNMQIDSRLIYNADLLWHRRRQSEAGATLSFGRINALGRYERDFDKGPDGERSGATEDGKRAVGAGQRIKKAMRKLVHLPEDEVQEELAWRVAEMIIKDVTDVTLNNNQQQQQNGGDAAGTQVANCRERDKSDAES